MGMRLHANEFARVGAVEVAAEMGAVSADHLLVMEPEDIEALRKAGTIAVLLPGTPLGLGLKDYAPARALIDAGVPVALATDCNPGTCPSENLALMISLACSQMKMTPAEAIVAATINSAYALESRSCAGQLGGGQAGGHSDLERAQPPPHSLSLRGQPCGSDFPGRRAGSRHAGQASTG